MANSVPTFLLFPGLLQLPIVVETVQGGGQERGNSFLQLQLPDFEADAPPSSSKDRLIYVGCRIRILHAHTETLLPAKKMHRREKKPRRRRTVDLSSSSRRDSSLTLLLPHLPPHCLWNFFAALLKPLSPIQEVYSARKMSSFSFREGGSREGKIRTASERTSNSRVFPTTEKKFFRTEHPCLSRSHPYS